MGKRTSFQFSIYTTKPIPQDYREGFQIASYPFVRGRSGPLPPDTLQQFLDLGVVHYRDEVNGIGILVQPEDGDETHIAERSGFLAYKSSGVLSWAEMKILGWSPDRDPEKYRKLVKKHGDGLAWMIWNQPCTILKLSEKEVRSV